MFQDYSNSGLCEYQDDVRGKINIPQVTENMKDRRGWKVQIQIWFLVVLKTELFIVQFYKKRHFVLYIMQFHLHGFFQYFCDGRKLPLTLCEKTSYFFHRSTSKVHSHYFSVNSLWSFRKNKNWSHNNNVVLKFGYFLCYAMTSC